MHSLPDLNPFKKGVGAGWFPTGLSWESWGNELVVGVICILGKEKIIVSTVWNAAAGRAGTVAEVI